MLIKLTDNDKMGGRKVPASNQTIKEEGHGEWGMGAQLHPGSNKHWRRSGNWENYQYTQNGKEPLNEKETPKYGL